jgi:hypothetical protein
LIGLNLSCWKLALNGAEPVHADTIAVALAEDGRDGEVR